MTRMIGVRSRCREFDKAATRSSGAVGASWNYCGHLLYWRHGRIGQIFMDISDPDELLWKPAQNGDEAAFARLQLRCRPIVFSEIRRRIHDVVSDDQEEIAQRVWIAVWRSLPGFQGRSRFSTWLTGIVKYVALDWVRRSRHECDSLDDEALERAQAAGEPSESDIVENLNLRDAIKKLPESERVVIVLSYVWRLTDDEIARRTNTPSGTVKSRKRAGLLRLRRILSDDLRGEDHEPPA